MSALCGEENHFTIDGSAAAEGGRPEVVVSGIKDDVTVRLRPVGKRLLYSNYLENFKRALTRSYVLYFKYILYLILILGSSIILRRKIDLRILLEVHVLTN